MLNIVNSQYNGNSIRILEEGEERYWNLQSMADACGSTKRVRSWVNLDTTQEYISALQNWYKTNGKKMSLISNPYWVKKGGDVRSENAVHDSGTWIHEELVTAAARWLDPSFSVWCDQTIKQYLLDGFVVNNQLTVDQITKLENELASAKKKNEKLLTCVSELSYEHEAHKIFAFAYLLVGGRRIKAEHVFNDVRFDFFEQRTDFTVVTELKAKTLTTSVVQHELGNIRGQKDYLTRAEDLFKQTHKRIRIKFLAPKINEESVTEYLNTMCETRPWLSFELKTWDDELDWLMWRYVQQGNSNSDCDIQFSVLRRRLVEIKQGRLIR